MKKRKPINWDKVGQSVKGGFDSVASGGSKIIDIATKAGIAYVGFNALKHPAGALTGLVALNLANSPNLAAGTAGVTALTALGMLSSVPPTVLPYDPLFPIDPDPSCPFPLWGLTNPILFPFALIAQQVCRMQQRAPVYTPPPGGNGGGGGGIYQP